MRSVTRTAVLPYATAYDSWSEVVGKGVGCWKRDAPGSVIMWELGSEAAESFESFEYAID